MEGESGEFHDWELLHDSSEFDSVISSDSVPNVTDFECFERESKGMIRTDYFSLDSRDNCLEIAASDQGSVGLDNLSWVDPESEAPAMGKESGEMWPDSGSDRNDECKFGEFKVNEELGFAGNGKTLVGFEGIGEISLKNELGFVENEKTPGGFEGSGVISLKNELGFVENGKAPVGFEGIGEISLKNESGFVGNEKTLLRFEEIREIGCMDEFLLEKNESGQVGNEENKTSFEGIGHASDVGKGISVNSDVGEEISAGENDGVPSGDQNTPPMEVVKAGGEKERKIVVWWKVPFELLKFCVFRASPVWTFSMAAAVMGLVILTRRLYKMKKNSQALQLKVTMNDKNVSQFMSRAARLNEAFSVVKRVPVIRPALPAAGGLTQWPVMNLR